MQKRLLVAGKVLFCFVIFTSHPASAQEDVLEANASSLPQVQTLATSSGRLQKAIFLSETAPAGNGSINVWGNAFIKNVTLTGTTSQCIEMRYSGEVKVIGGQFPFSMQFRALVDGIVAHGGTPLFDAIDSNVYTTTAMNWWRCGLNPGTHSVQIQFGPYYSDLTSYVRNRTLIIEYKQ